MTQAGASITLTVAFLIVGGLSAQVNAGSEDQSVVSHDISAGKVMNEETLRSLEQVKAEEHGPLTGHVLEFLTVMHSIVNMDKEPAITAEDWAPLGELVDRATFHRVGNYGEHVNWGEYVDLLTRWANSSWWKGYIFRVREVPATQDQPGLVYLESEERSNSEHPVREDGDYSTLQSIAIYQFDDEGKITALHVYDQRPL